MVKPQSNELNSLNMGKDLFLYRFYGFEQRECPQLVLTAFYVRNTLSKNISKCYYWWSDFGKFKCWLVKSHGNLQWGSKKEALLNGVLATVKFKSKRFCLAPSVSDQLIVKDFKSCVTAVTLKNCCIVVLKEFSVLDNLKSQLGKIV